MGTGSYNFKELEFFMHSEKVFAALTGRFVGFGVHCLCRRQCVRSSFNPISQN